jgi:hypothetical protein
MELMSRRLFLALIVGATLVSVAPPLALADSGSGGGGGNSGNGGGGQSGDGGGDDGDDNGGDDSNSGSGSSGSSGSSGKSVNQDGARAAVQAGKAASLRKLLAFISSNYSGDVLDVRLRQNGGRYIYVVKMLSRQNLLRSVVLDAKTLKKI